MQGRKDIWLPHWPRIMQYWLMDLRLLTPFSVISLLKIYCHQKIPAWSWKIELGICIWRPELKDVRPKDEIGDFKWLYCRTTGSMCQHWGRHGADSALVEGWSGSKHCFIEHRSADILFVKHLLLHFSNAGKVRFLPSNSSLFCS